MREILKGVCDLHVHAGPSVANRALDAVDMFYEAEKAGYAGYLVKDHYFPTVMGTNMIDTQLGKGKVRVFGGIALNNSVGLFNLNAVDAAVAMGAKIVYFPTVSSNHHIVEHKGHFPGAGANSVVENPVMYLTEKGEVRDDALAVIKYMAEHPEVILATGHGSAKEIDAMIQKAVELGVKKILVNHPHYLIGATIEEIERWGKLGAYIELNACVTQGVSEKFGVVPASVIDSILQVVPLEQIIVDSDMGQANNGSPVEGLLKFIELLMKDCRLTEADINKVAKEVPAMLVGM